MDAPRPRRNPNGIGSARPGSRSSRRILSGSLPELGGGLGILGSGMTDEAVPSNPPTASTITTTTTKTHTSYNSFGNSPISPTGPAPPLSIPLSSSTRPKAATAQAAPPQSTSTVDGSSPPRHNGHLPPGAPIPSLPSFSTWGSSANASSSGPPSASSSDSSSVPAAAAASDRKQLRADQPKPLPPMAQGALPALPSVLGGASSSSPTAARDTSAPSSLRGTPKKSKHKKVSGSVASVAGPSGTTPTGGRVDDFGDIVSDFEPGRHAPAPPPQFHTHSNSKTTALHFADSRPPQHHNQHHHHNRSVTEPAAAFTHSRGGSTSTGNGSGGGSARRSEDTMRGFNGRKKSPVDAPVMRGIGANGSENQARRDDGHTRQRNVTAPTIKPRRSTDLLRRPSAELLGIFRSDPDKQAAREAKAAPQRALGVDSEPRKSPGMTLKKSSGALRNLFRGSKSKGEQSPPPDMPPSGSAPRASFALSDLLRPNPQVSGPTAPLSVSAPFQPDTRPSSAYSSSSSTRVTPMPRPGSDRELPPLPPADDDQTRPGLSPIDTKGSKLPSPALSKTSPRFTSPLSQSSGKLPSPQAPPSPQHHGRLPTAASLAANPPAFTQQPPKASKAKAALDATASKQADMLRYSKLPPRGASKSANSSNTRSPTGSDGAGSSGSTSTVRQLSESGSSGSINSLAAEGQVWKGLDTNAGLGHSTSFNLLQLPELDLNFDTFDFSFDGFGGASSPTTPRKRSPSGTKNGSQPGTPGSHSRSASANGTFLASPTNRGERRRSKSFDGLNGSAPDDAWRTLDFDKSWSNKLFTASSSSASAPKLTTTAPKLTTTAPTPAPVPAPVSTSAEFKTRSGTDESAATPSTATHSVGTSQETDSLSTHRSSFDHSRTPSGGSSTNDTSSPSPPRTPEDAHSAFLANADAKPTRSSLDPPIALDVPMEQQAPPPIAQPMPIGTRDSLEQTLLPYDAGYTAPSAMDATPSASSQVTPTKSLDLAATPRADPTALVSEASTPKAETPTPTPSASSQMLLDKPEVPRREPELQPQPIVREPEPQPAKEPEPEPQPEPVRLPEAPPAPQPEPTPAPKPRRPSGARLVHDNPAKPPRELDEPKEPEQLPAAKAPFRCRPTARPLISQAKVVMPDNKLTIRDLTEDLGRALDNFRYPTAGAGPERSSIIRTKLTALVQEIDRRCYNRSEESSYRELREVCFDWADSLLFELRVEQPANERGACLEGLAAVLESQCLSAESLESSPSHQHAFLNLMMKVMNFAMDKLGAKGVFHNTLLFSGRFLAFAFFRVPHVGGQLVGVLQPPRGALMRFTRPVLMGRTVPPEAQPQYPEHLRALCFDDSQSYTRRLLSLDLSFDSAAEKDAFHFQPGNWLRRWQSDDSELFPAFYRAYHKQLATYLAPAIGYYQLQKRPIPASVLLRAPGYAHLATIFAIKCHSYILGSVNAVTTSSSAQHFDATESAGFRGSQKPAVLETANRRLVETLWMFSSAPVSVPTQDNLVVQCDGSQLWGEMVDLWTKNLITKTSLYAPKGVFCLFDLLDGLVDPVVWGDSHSPLDVPYLIGLFRVVLNEGEHALTLVKAIAFVFTHWEILTARPEDRRELCMDILLDKKLFERLLLFWSQSVRSYVLRLVVFRLGHLHTTKDDGLSYEVEIQSVRLLQSRLDRIKKRYDELEPQSPDGIETSSSLTPRTPTTPSLPRSRSTITMITDSPQAPTRAERLLAKDEDDKDGKSKGSWWKRTLGMQKKGKAAAAAMAAAATSAATGGGNRPSQPASPIVADKSPKSTGSLASNGSGSPRTTPSSQLPPSRGSGTAVGNANGRKADGSSSLGPSLMPPEVGTPTAAMSSSAKGARKSPPPNISTEGGPKPLTRAISDAKAAQFAFEFELPTASPLSDTFEASLSNPTSPRRNSQPASPRSSPHMSHSFSKRSSLLPPQTEKALEAFGAHTPRKPEKDRDPGYPAKLHAYAIRMLAELEDAQKEYDEWWSEGGIGKVDGAPPRLAVAWPFHEGED